MRRRGFLCFFPHCLSEATSSRNTPRFLNGPIGIFSFWSRSGSFGCSGSEPKWGAHQQREAAAFPPPSVTLPFKYILKKILCHYFTFWFFPQLCKSSQKTILLPVCVVDKWLAYHHVFSLSDLCKKLHAFSAPGLSEE